MLFVHRCLLIFHLVDILQWMLIGRASYDLLLIECILTGRLKFLSHINPPLPRQSSTSSKLTPLLSAPSL